MLSRFYTCKSRVFCESSIGIIDKKSSCFLKRNRILSRNNQISKAIIIYICPRAVGISKRMRKRKRSKGSSIIDKKRKTILSICKNIRMPIIIKVHKVRSARNGLGLWKNIERVSRKPCNVIFIIFIHSLPEYQNIQIPINSQYLRVQCLFLPREFALE